MPKFWKLWVFLCLFFSQLSGQDRTVDQCVIHIVNWDLLPCTQQQLLGCIHKAVMYNRGTQTPGQLFKTNQLYLFMLVFGSRGGRNHFLLFPSSPPFNLISPISAVPKSIWSGTHCRIPSQVKLQTKLKALPEWLKMKHASRDWTKESVFSKTLFT